MRLILPLGILVILTSPMQAQRLPIFPDSLRQDAHTVIQEQHVEMVIHSAAEGTYRFRQAVTLLNDASTANVLRVFYDPAKPISRLSAKVYDFLGREVAKFQKADFEDVATLDGFSVYQDDRVKWLRVVGQQYPYTIEWEYEQKMSGSIMAYLPDWVILRYGEAVAQSSFAVNLPDNLDLLYRSFNFDVAPEVSVEKNRRRWLWQVKNLTSRRSEPASPTAELLLPQVQVTLSQFEIMGIKGSMADWKSYGNFLHQLYQGLDEVPTDLVALLQPGVEACRTQREKITYLYRYLQDNMRYVSIQLGIGGWRPFPATYVHENKYGDCKALSNFMKAILGHFGIAANLVVIENGRNPQPLSPGFAPDPTFNHMILYVPAEDWWLECTSNSFPPNYIGFNNCNRQALVVTAEGGKIMATPTATAADQLERWEADLILAPDGRSSMQATAQCQGSSFEHWRGMMDYLNATEQRQYLEKESGWAIQRLDTLRVEAQRDQPRAQVKVAAELLRMATRSGKRLFIPCNNLLPVSKVPVKAERPRQLPVVTADAYVRETQLTVQLPSGFALEGLPFASKELDSPFGRYQLRLEDAGSGRLRIHRKLEVWATQQPANQYEALYQFYRDVTRLDQTKLVAVSP